MCCVLDGKMHIYIYIYIYIFATTQRDDPYQTLRIFKNKRPTWCHSLFLFHSMLNMFRTLIHPSSGACDFSIVSPHWLCVLVSMCFGVSVWPDEKNLLSVPEFEPRIVQSVAWAPRRLPTCVRGDMVFEVLACCSRNNFWGSLVWVGTVIGACLLWAAAAAANWPGAELQLNFAWQLCRVGCWTSRHSSGYLVDITRWQTDRRERHPVIRSVIDILLKRAFNF